MTELFIELFSEEIPSKLQIDARQRIKQMLEEKLEKKEIKFNSSKSFSTPKRLVFVINGIPEKIEQKKKIIKGPKVGSPQIALDGFIKSNNLSRLDVYKKKLEKGEFYFAKTQPRTVNSIVEASLRMGVDGIKVEIDPWSSKEDEFLGKFTVNETIANTAYLASECKKWNLPLMVESIPIWFAQS